METVGLFGADGGGFVRLFIPEAYVIGIEIKAVLVAFKVLPCQQDERPVVSVPENPAGAVFQLQEIIRVYF